jgi:allophanate hydrolase
MTPVKAVQAAYQRIEAQPLRPVWITLVPREHALNRATHVPSGAPLGGLTFALKDNIDYAGLPTTAGCPAFAYTPEQTAFVVAQLERAGAVAVGKTNLDQFATGLVGVRSPYGACASVFDAAYVSGGSSSGSAVAVARGWVDFALGTDTAGSGRVPAAFNNLIGLKPTRGLLSGSGVVPACRSLDCVSIFTRDIATARRVFAAAAQFDAADRYARRYQPAGFPWASTRFRFGYLPEPQREFFGDTEAAKLYAASLEKLAAAGGEGVEIDYTHFREAAQLLYAGPWVAERRAALGRFLDDHPEDLHPTVRAIIQGADRYRAVDAFEAAYRLAACARRTEATWSRVDFLALPTTGTIYRIADVEAEPVQLNTNLGYYTNFVNLLDLAALAVPAGFRPNGLPFGITLIAPAQADDALLNVGARYLGEGAVHPAPGCVTLSVVGAHLTGMPLNHELTSRGARLLRTTKTAPDYRLYHLANTTPPKPGLRRTPGFSGPGIEVEVWSLTAAAFGDFVAHVPAPMGIGTVTLADGSDVKGFLCEAFALEGARDITEFGGWRAYRNAR